MRLGYTILFLSMFIVGCSKPAKEFSDSTDPDSLMQVALPGWNAKDGVILRVTQTPDKESKDQTPEVSYFTMKPQLVVQLDSEHVVLIASGSPSTEKGEPNAGHSSSAILNAYWFSLKQGQWRKTAEQIQFGDEGFSGDLGTIKMVVLSDKQKGLSVRTGSCWQGSCIELLSLYLVGEREISHIFGEQIEENTEGSSENCANLMSLKLGEQKTYPADANDDESCRSIKATWEIKPKGKTIADLIISYSGKSVVAVKTSSNVSQPDIPAGFNPAGLPIEDVDSEPSSSQERLLMLQPIEAKQIYRFSNGKYQAVQGKNPNKGV